MRKDKKIYIERFTHKQKTAKGVKEINAIL